MISVTLYEHVAQLTPEARHRLAARLGVTTAGTPPLHSASASATERTTLIAYYVTTTGRPIPAEACREFLGKTLPSYLIPSLFCHIESVPRTLHGKVDTAALPNPAITVPLLSYAREAAPREIEVELLSVWQSVLGVDRLGVEDSFFDLGGDSLLGIRLLGQIRDRWNIDLSMTSLFDHPTVAGAAAQIEAILWARNSGHQHAQEGSDGHEEIEF